MSFILDALRKSDAERQRTTTPGLVDVRYAARKTARRSWWMPMLVVVLLANMVLMAVFWFRDSEPQVAPVAVNAAPEPPASIRPLSRELEQPGTDQLPWRDNSAPEPPVIAETSEAALPLPVTQPQPETVMAPSAAAAGADVSSGTSTDASALPSVDEMIGSGRLATPALNLDLHVYGSDPGKRFVVINSRRYTESTQLAEGPVIETITPDGVILSNRGARFFLPRR